MTMIHHLSTCPQAVSLYAECTCGARSGRTESEYRKSLVAKLRAEGADDSTVSRLTTDETVKRMVDYERQTLGIIAGMFK